MSQPYRFTTSPKIHHIPDVPFELDDVEYVARAPKRAVWVQMVSAESPQEVMRALGRFLDACLDEEDAAALNHRLRDRRDDLDMDDLFDIVEYLLEEWRPYLDDELTELLGERPAERRGVKTPQDRKAPTARATSKRTPVRRKAPAMAEGA